MAGQQTLTLLIGVRIPVSQPCKSKGFSENAETLFFVLRSDSGSDQKLCLRK